MNATQRAATLPVRFFRRTADVVARELLGAVIVSTAGGLRTAGRIVETEAYLGYDDPASHGYRGRRTRRNAALFGQPGTWYVYLSYGMHWCANLVCARQESGSAVLLRALEPLEGLDVMRARRSGAADRALAAGPGRLCQALGIDVALDGQRMESSPVVVLKTESPPPAAVAATPRIGITVAADWPLRFVIAGSPWVSRGRRDARVDQ
ncbi:MAG TPA: DNA-3-methyladenine glycosylase [Gemmatimonadales bacterium]|nr:DNA-3-methyladenine glycosylase [Gemmatimonadales bacterium]